MTERSTESLSKHVERFLSGGEHADEVIEQIRLNNPNAKDAQIFHIISKGKGKGKSHASAFTADQYQDKIKRG